MDKLWSKNPEQAPTTSPDTSAREKKLKSKHKHEERKDGKHKDQDPCLASPEVKYTDKDIMYPGSTASCDSSTSQQAPSIQGPIDPEEAIVCPGSPASCDSSSSEQAPYAQDSDCSKSFVSREETTEKVKCGPPALCVSFNSEHGRTVQDSDCSKSFVSREETTEKVKCGPPALCVSFNSEHGRTVQDCSFPTSMAPEEEDSDDFACEVAASPASFSDSPTSFDFSSSGPTLTLKDQDGNYLSSLKFKSPSKKKRRKRLHDRNGNSQSPLNFMSPLSVPSNFAQATESDNEEDTTLPSGVSVKCEEDHVNDEVYGLCTPLTLESNDALFNVLKHFEIRNQSDVAFILKVSQKLTSALKSFESQDIKIKEETL
ncbi:uncharacterized protein O3C94_007321 [Discoglossus pictus]